MPQFINQPLAKIQPRRNLDFSPFTKLINEHEEKKKLEARNNAMAELIPQSQTDPLAAASEAYKTGNGVFGNFLLSQKAQNDRAAANAARQDKVFENNNNWREREFGLKQQGMQQDQELKTANLGLKRAELNNELSKTNSYNNLNGFKDKKQKLSAQGDFRKEFNKVSGDYIKVRDAHSRVAASLENPSAAGDLAAIFNYMKVLDPGSTVREGEFATAQNAAGVPDIVRAQFNRLKNGEFLTPKQRGDFLNRSGLLFNKQEEQYNKNREFYRGVAKRNGLDERNVIPDLSISKPPEKKVIKDQFSINNIPKEVRDAASKAIANGKSRESVLKFLREKYGGAE